MEIINNFTNYFKGRFNRHYREKKIHLVVDIVLAFIILILIVFVISIKFGDFSYKNKLAFEVASNREKIISGQEAIFEVKYANISKLNLVKTKFSFNSPNGFILKEVSPDSVFDKKTNSFEVGDLIPGANGIIKIKGYFIGATGSDKEIIFNASYFLDNKFTNELFSKNFIIDSSGLELKWNNDGVLYRRQPTAMSLSLKNISQLDLDNLEFSFINSDVYLSAEETDDKNIKSEEGRLKIKQIKSGADLNINFNLTYNGEGGTAEVKLIGRAAMNGETINQADLAETFNVKEPNLSIKINPVQPVINIDDDIVYKIILKNSGLKNIDNLVLNLLPGDSKHFLNSVKMKNLPFIRLTGNQIIFDKSLRPDEVQEIEITAKFSRPEIFINDEARLKATAGYNVDGTSLKAHYLADAAKIRTVYQFKVEARYFSIYGDQLGVGPIPPAAGIPTKYWIFWQLKNHGNELSNFQVSAELPPGVIWLDEDSVIKGNLNFDKQKNIFIWQVDAIDGLEENCRLALALTIIPNAGDVSKNILLLKNIKYEFYDKFTGETVINSAGNLTNDLSGDSYAVIAEKQNNR